MSHPNLGSHIRQRATSSLLRAEDQNGKPATRELSEESSEDDLDVVATPWQDMPEDAYGAGITALIKDVHFLILENDKTCVRIFRLFFSVGVVVFVQALQVFLIYRMKQLVTGRAVYSAQKDYQEFKDTVYHDGEPDQEIFNAFSLEEKATLCSIPLTQPLFFGGILFVWSFSAMFHVRDCWHLSCVYLKNTPTVSSLENILELADDEGTLRLVGLTIPLKCTILALLISRFIVTVWLLILGTRWLNATFDWGELLLNAVALEFMLMLKDVVFHVTVSQRMKIDMQHLQTRMFPEDQVQVSAATSLRGLVFFILSLGWVVGYFNFQTVLPNFFLSQESKDLNTLCHDYLHDSQSFIESIS